MGWALVGDADESAKRFHRTSPEAELDGQGTPTPWWLCGERRCCRSARLSFDTRVPEGTSEADAVLPVGSRLPRASLEELGRLLVGHGSTVREGERRVCKGSPPWPECGQAPGLLRCGSNTLKECPRTNIGSLQVGRELQTPRVPWAYALRGTISATLGGFSVRGRTDFTRTVFVACLPTGLFETDSHVLHPFESLVKECLAVLGPT